MSVVGVSVDLRESHPVDWTRDGYTITTDPDRIDRSAVRRFLADSYWAADRPAEVIDRSLDRSLAFALIHDGRQVGMARVVTDSATFAWLCDVYVDEAARGCGIGRAMVSALMADARLQTVRRWCLATRDAHEVYRPLGFQPVEGRIWMQHLPDTARWT